MSFLSDIWEQKADGTVAVISQGHGLMQLMASLAVKSFSLGEIIPNQKWLKLSYLNLLTTTTFSCFA